MVPYWTVWRRSVLRDVLLSFGKDLFHLISLLKLNSKSDAVKTVAAQSHFSPVYIFFFLNINQSFITYSTNVSLSHLWTLSSLWLRGLACQSSFNMYNA